MRNKYPEKALHDIFPKFFFLSHMTLIFLHYILGLDLHALCDSFHWFLFPYDFFLLFCIGFGCASSHVSWYFMIHSTSAPSHMTLTFFHHYVLDLHLQALLILCLVVLENIFSTSSRACILKL